MAFPRRRFAFRRRYSMYRRRNPAIRRSLPSNCYTNIAQRKVMDTPGQLDLYTTGDRDPINVISPGTSVFQRLGRRVFMRSIQIRGKFFVSAVGSALTNYTTARLFLIYDRQSNGAAMNMNDFLQTYLNTGASAVYDGRVFTNPESFNRYTVLMDKQFLLPIVQIGVVTPSACLDPTVSLQVSKFRKLFNLCTDYNADTSPSTFADVNSGTLYLAGISDNASGGVACTWSFAYTTRLRFGDTRG